MFTTHKGKRWTITIGSVLVILLCVWLVSVVASTSHPVAGESSLPPVTTASPSASAQPADPLWKSWHAPADLPATGTISTVQIPATTSGFNARDAEVYLPPAALVAQPPTLPFVLMMMGQPGEPDAGPIAEVLDSFAATHQGLAPIVVVADQLGDPDVDSLCLDTPEYGNIETYIQHDVTAWARANLNIATDRVDWTVAGFSNGGQCAISLASKYPDVWGNVISASGTAYAGVESESDVLEQIFGGDQSEYDAIKPATIMAETHYPDTVAVFTVGADDDFIRPGITQLSADASAAGMDTTLYVVAGEGHTTEALTAGLTKAFEILYPRFGLEQPR